MTIANQTVKDVYVADGVNRNWEWTFQVLSTEDIKIKVVSEDGEEKEVTEGYELNETLRRIVYPVPADNVPALAAGNKVVIYRNTPITQNIDLMRNGTLDAETLEVGYDKRTMVEQELAEQVKRAIKFPISEASPETNAAEYLERVETSAAAAKEYASNAKDSADDAQVSATAADNGASAAVAAATAAEASKTEAENSAAQAATRAGNAASSADSASASASAAWESGQSAALSAQEAAQTLAFVNAAGATQTEAVNAAGAQQVSAVEAAGEEQIQLAKDWASKTSGPVDEGEYSAKKYAQNAAVADNQAQQSAQGAAASASAASAGAAAAQAAKKAAEEAADLAESIAQGLSSVFEYKGNVPTEKDLPANAQTGDVYTVGAEDDLNKAEYVWTGERWEKLGTAVDLSGYLTAEAAADTYATIETVSGKANKAIPAKSGNIATLTGGGDLADGGRKGALANLDVVDKNQIVDSAIISSKLSSGAVTNGKIADNAVGYSNIQDAAIGGAKIAQHTITNAHIAPNAQIEQTKIQGLSEAFGLKADKANTYTKEEVDAASEAFLPKNQKGASGGVASLDANAKVPPGQLPDLSETYIPSEQKNTANGVAGLNASGKMYASQIPVDGSTISFDDNGNLKAEVGGAGGLGRAVGEVYFSQSSLASDNPGALPLFTGELIASANTIYPGFWTWVKRHTELCTTKADYDARLTQYGECPYYVVDETAGSLRLPLLKNYVKMANASGGITQKAAGLPNITGTWKPAGLDTNNYEDPTGAFANSKHSSNGYLGHVSKTGQTPFADFDASLSNEIYGSSDTVTPSHTTLYPWVGAFNAAIPASTAQAAQFQQGLSGKADADLGNVLPLSQARVNAIMPADMDYVVERWQASEPSVTWANIPFYNSYEIYKSGWCRQYIYAANNTAVTYLKPFAKTPHIKTDMFGLAGSAYFAHNVGTNNGDLKTGCSVNWSGSEANPHGVLIVAEGFVEE